MCQSLSGANSWAALLKIKSMSFYGLLRFNFKKRRAKSIEKKISFMAAD